MEVGGFSQVVCLADCSVRFRSLDLHPSGRNILLCLPQSEKVSFYNLMLCDYFLQTVALLQGQAEIASGKDCTISVPCQQGVLCK